jgi:hypothetical protein
VKIRSVAVATITILAVGLGMTAQADAAGGVRFTKIQYDSPGGDYGSNRSLNAEWVTIKNNGTRARNLTDWRLADRGANYVYHFPTYTLGAGKSVRVHTGSGQDTRANLYWDLDEYVWDNDGDKASLRNSALIDTCRWGDGSGVKNC